MYMALGHVVLTMLVGLALGLLWDFPMGVRWQKVILYRDCFQWLRAGRHRRSELNKLEESFDAAMLAATGTDSKLAASAAAAESKENAVGVVNNGAIYDSLF